MTWYDIKKAVISWVSDIRIYPGGIILFGDSHYELKGNHMREILDVLKPGDLLLRRYAHYLGSVAIPGYWSHAAIYVGSDKVIHMLGDGIQIDDILVFMRCDDMLVLRHKNPEVVKNAIECAYVQLGKGIEYDFDFDTDDSEKFYCTEFVDFCFDRVVDIRGPFSVESILPDSFLLCPELDVVWKNEKNKEKMQRKLKC